MNKPTRVWMNSGLLVLAMLAAGCSVTTVPENDPGKTVNDGNGPWDHGHVQEPFRIAVISDTHLWSVSHEHNDRFVEVGAELAELDPAVTRVVSTGDNIDDLFTSPDFIASGQTPEVLKKYRQMIEDNYPMPFHAVLGNHDDRFLDQFLGKDMPLAAWEDAFQGSDAWSEPYYSVDVGGFSFVILDSTDLAFDHDSNDLPTFGKEQLQWLAEKLDRGLPTVLFWHHWIADPGELDDNDSPIFPVIYEYRDVVKAVFLGHKHHFAKYEWNGVKFYQTDNLPDPDPAWHLVECDPSTGDVVVVNEAEIDYGG